MDGLGANKGVETAVQPGTGSQAQSKSLRGARLSQRACLPYLSFVLRTKQRSNLGQVLPWALRYVDNYVKPHSGRVALASSQGEQKGGICSRSHSRASGPRQEKGL